MADTLALTDHQQAAVDSIRMWLLGLGSLTLDEVNDLAPKFVTAATPHLRAAWEQEMAEKIRAKFLGPDFGRNPVNGQDSPDAELHAAYDEGLQTALALLEGGADCCLHEPDICDMCYGREQAAQHIEHGGDQ